MTRVVLFHCAPSSSPSPSSSSLLASSCWAPCPSVVLLDVASSCVVAALLAGELLLGLGLHLGKDRVQGPSCLLHEIQTGTKTYRGPAPNAASTSNPEPHDGKGP